MDIGGDNIKLLSRLLSASSLRGRVISGNITNQNTPGFKRRIVQFEDQLREAMATHSPQAGNLMPEVIKDTETPSKPDGNNVNMETEMNAMRENRLTFETYATILQSRLSMIDSAIREGR